MLLLLFVVEILHDLGEKTAGAIVLSGQEPIPTISRICPD